MSVLDTSRILDRGLNCAIMHITSRLFPCGFDVSEHAPSTYDGLVSMIEERGRMVVWNGASDTSIYGDVEVNYAFRAWHDWCHWRGKHDFSEEGERASYVMQCQHLTGLYGDSPMVRRWHYILHAEIIGQVAYSNIHGDFPRNQLEFVKHWLVSPVYAINTRH